MATRPIRVTGERGVMCERSTSRVIAHSRTWFALSLMGGGRSSSSSSRDPAESPTPPPPEARMHDALRRLLRGAAALPRTCKSGVRAATAANMFVCFLKAPTPVRGRRFVGGLSSKSILSFLRFVWSLLFWGFFGGGGFSTQAIFHSSSTIDLLHLWMSSGFYQTEHRDDKK